MRNPSYTIIGNWKMYFSFDQAIKWIRTVKDELNEVCLQSENSLVLCPSFESLYPIQQELSHFHINLGAQDCSNYSQGAYTGQIQARSLSEINCSHCIVGHSERRSYQQETSNQTAEKVALLLENKISPVVCIGESKHEYESGKSELILSEQLKPISKIISSTSSPIPFFIAYEPIWSIGTGIIPENNYLEQIFSFIKTNTNQWSNKKSIHLLYGGSVNAKTCLIIKSVKNVEGFLIGKASTDFQELKKIVLSL